MSPDSGVWSILEALETAGGPKTRSVKWAMDTLHVRQTRPLWRSKYHQSTVVAYITDTGALRIESESRGSVVGIELKPNDVLGLGEFLLDMFDPERMTS